MKNLLFKELNNLISAIILLLKRKKIQKEVSLSSVENNISFLEVGLDNYWNLNFIKRSNNFWSNVKSYELILKINNT